MATTTESNKGTVEGGMNGHARWWNILRTVGWSAAALILLAPLVAMLFTGEVEWSAGDFLFAFLLLGGSGLVFELVLRRSNDTAYRAGALLALAAAFLLIWSNAAVGFVGSGANTANVLYFAMVAVPLIGGSVTGFKARGMFLTMLFTAIVQAAITGYVFAADLVHAEGGGPVLAINAIFILLWTASALLFHHASPAWSARSIAQGVRVQFVLSLLLVAIGAVLLAYMITVESEPGALPLLVVLVGVGWSILTLFRSRSSTRTR